MKRQSELMPAFVELIPPELKDGVIYVSMVYGTAVHKCCCGCGRKVVTPFGPTDWKLTFDGESVSLSPSIGNWSLPCQSHYWIKRNRVEWAPRWSRDKVEAGRAHDLLAREKYFGRTNVPSRGDFKASVDGPVEGKSDEGVWSKLKKWWRRP